MGCLLLLPEHILCPLICKLWQPPDHIELFMSVDKQGREKKKKKKSYSTLWANQP